MANFGLIHFMFKHRKNIIPNHDNMGILSEEKIKEIDQKQVFSFKYAGQHGDIFTSYWPSLEKAKKAKLELEEQGYDVSNISIK